MSSLFCTLRAQERGNYLYEKEAQDEPQRTFEVDTTLFRLPITTFVDFYGDATRYYNVPGSSARRGLYYTTAQQLLSEGVDYFETLYEPLSAKSVALYAAQSGYRVGLRAAYADMLDENWSIDGALWAQSGRDMFIEGVFRNTFSPQVTLSRRFSGLSFLRIDGSFYYSMRGQQYGSTPEAFSLVGSTYYNPSWGFYNGRVRSARVRRDISPEINLHYQYDLGGQRTLILEGDISYSRRANSSLGWYDATTPMPDYYRKMPSFLSDGEVKDYVTDLWRTNNTDYTQINWDELVRQNSLSPDGEAFYVVEDKVERRTSGRFAAIYNCVTPSNVNLTLGFDGSRSYNRNFKVLNDLLGADYLTDYDQFISDSYNKTMPLQNDLASPDRQVVQGDRFGYDYTIVSNSAALVARAKYRAQRLDFDLSARIASESYQRIGHYEKERFSGSASLGESTLISTSPYDLRASVGYAHGANLYVALKLNSTRLSARASNLFLNAQAANYLSPSLNGELIHSASLAFRYNGGRFSLMGEIYGLRSVDGSSLYWLYDDLSGSMCRASITQIEYSSYGVELTSNLYLHDDLRLSATLSAGRYYYSDDPYVELFDDYTLTSISSATLSRMEGATIGNAPQVIVTSSATYFGLNRYILCASASCAALRYEQPSMVRRSERLLDQAFINEQSASAALAQQRLGDIYDIELSASRFFWVGDGEYISLRIAIDNLLGQSDRVYYAKQSDRVLLQSVDGYFTGATMREGLYQYGAARTIKLSVNYKF